MNEDKERRHILIISFAFFFFAIAISFMLGWSVRGDYDHWQLRENGVLKGPELYQLIDDLPQHPAFTIAGAGQ